MKGTSLFERLAFWLSRSEGVKNQSYNEALLLLTAVFATAPLMWSYAFNSYFTVSNLYYLHPLAFLYSIVHSLSFLLYRLRPSRVLVTNVFIGAGFIFQFHHSTVTGGFFSTTVIWLTLLPLIVGVVSTVRHMMVWAFIVTIGLLSEYFLTSYGLTYNEITELGRIWGQLNIAFGYGFINICLILAYRDNELRAMMKLERKQKKIKSLFRILIHDISNPLTLIMFSNESLEKELSDPNQKALLKRIDRGCLTINSIINSTKAFEKSSQQKIFKLGTVNLKESIDECLDILRVQLESKDISVEIDLAPEVYVLGQPDALTHQVLMNIISNAIKFSYPHSKILISSKPEDERVALSIQDFGTGMSQKVLKNLFDEGANTSIVGTGGEKGTGFGMPIAFMTLKRMHGELKVVSSQIEGQSGTTFTIFLEKLDS